MVSATRVVFCDVILFILCYLVSGLNLEQGWGSTWTRDGVNLDQGCGSTSPRDGDQLAQLDLDMRGG